MVQLPAEELLIEAAGKRQASWVGPPVAQRLQGDDLGNRGPIEAQALGVGRSLDGCLEGAVAEILQTDQPAPLVVAKDPRHRIAPPRQIALYIQKRELRETETWCAELVGFERLVGKLHDDGTWWRTTGQVYPVVTAAGSVAGQRFDRPLPPSGEVAYERDQDFGQHRLIQHWRDNTWREMSATEAVERDPRLALGALAAEWQVPCDAAQIEALLGYAELLLHWNARINLTGARSVNALVQSHFPDAFALAGWLEGPAGVIDVGSGGGLPALPLALLRPGLDVQLCEPIAKKGAFLRTAIRELGLTGRVRLDTRRAEEVAESGGAFDAAISRATFTPDVWLALARRLVRPGGRVFALSTPQANLDRSLGRSRIYAQGRRVLVEVVA
jgi:16S rRNA (guanine527-N7)-methyltransferase